MEKGETYGKYSEGFFFVTPPCHCAVDFSGGAGGFDCC